MPFLQNPICVPLDMPDILAARDMTERLAPVIGMVKIGMEFFYANGIEGYQIIAETGVPVFLDLKLHDIPNTVAQGLLSLMRMPHRPLIVNIHVGAGGATMRAAAEAIGSLDPPNPKLIGVTVLTSLDHPDLIELGFDPILRPVDLVSTKAKLAKSCGLDGVVCSPNEIGMVKKACGEEFLTVVPGIRPAGAGQQDQKRVATPGSAYASGADVLVIGRAITQADDPYDAASAILRELEMSDAG